MIKVVFVLVVLSLSAILAYLVLSNKKGSSKQSLVPKTNAKSNETQEQEDEDTSLTATSRSIETEPPEDEDTSSTANAQPIETEPPVEEYPGTCEITGDWAMSGECQADGTAIFTQTYKESKPGACPSNEKARVKPCCYQGDWKDTSGCNERGRKTQEQTTINCAEIFKTREVDCTYVSPWRKTGECGADGKKYYVRDVINSTESREKSENCCYISPWGGCNGSKRHRTRNRTVINCPSGTPMSETGSQDCNRCQDKWVHGGYRYRSCVCTKKPRYGSCREYKKYRYEDLKYVITKNATNGGNACPHRSGETKYSGNMTRIGCSKTPIMYK